MQNKHVTFDEIYDILAVRIIFTPDKREEEINECFNIYVAISKIYTNYKPGRYTWSWIIWQDSATNYDDQVKMIDLAATMGYEYTLVDALWDTQIGRDRMEQLSKYAQSKGIKLLLWYNSNGNWNDAPQGPRYGMSVSALPASRSISSEVTSRR